MRASLLMLLIGAVAAEPFFRSGREYEFDYKGKVMSGIPGLDSHYAGLKMRAKVILTSLQFNKFMISMRNVRVVNFNERLEGEEPKNWRTMITPESSPVDSSYETILQSPIQFNMVDGKISEIQASENEPEWALNIKKSLISLMKVRVSDDQQRLRQNTVRSQAGSMPSIWKVYEQGIDGKCENTYQISEVPQYLIKEVFPDMRVERCEGKQVFQITKVRDVNKCVVRSAYQINQPGRYECSTGNCGSMWQRSSMVKYVGCGSSAIDMELQLILNEGELQQDLLGYSTESVVTGTRQVLKLESSKSISSAVPQKIQSPRTLGDLLYEYPRNVDFNRRSSSRREMHSFRDQQDQLQHQEKNPAAQRFEPTLTEDILAKLSPNTLKEKIVKELSQIVQDLNEVEEFEKKQVSNRILSISKVFSLLSASTMKSLYQEVKTLGVADEDKETMRQLVLEISVMTGTNPSIMFLKELIESEEVSAIRAGVTIATIPHYIVTPTVEILDQLFELVKSPAVTKHHLLRVNSQLAFATLLNRACIDPSKNTRFPVFVFGEFCNSQTSELTTKYIPYLVSQLQSDQQPERLAALFALGTLGHESVLPILMPYLEGKAEKSSAFIQRMTIYSLSTATPLNRDTLLPVYSSLVHNPSEDRNVRIAALSMMLKMQPSTAYFQKLATSTWYEKDNEFHKFVFSTLKSLSEIKIANVPAYTDLYYLVNRARSVLPLAKPTPVVISSTLNYFTAEWLRDLQVGYQFQGAYTIVSNMKGAYAKLEYHLEQLKFTPIEVAFNMEGTGRLAEKLFNNLAQGEKSSADKLHPELREIMSSIDLQSGKDTPLEVNFWGKMFNDVQVVYGLHKENVDPIISKIKKTISDPRLIKTVCGKTPFNFVKVNNPAPTNILIPSDLGLPILIEFHMPTVMAMKGEINVDCSRGIPSVTLDLTQKHSASFYGYAGTISPFTQEVIAVGINENWNVNYPTKTVVELEMGKLKMTFKSTEQGKQARKPIDVLAYSVKPFATIKPLVFLDGTSIVSHANTKTIRTENERKTYPLQLGESLGLDLKIELESEAVIIDPKAVLNKLALYKNNPLNIILFSWTNGALRTDNDKPSSRYHTARLVYNPRQSTTNEIEVDLSMALAVQSQGQNPKAVSVDNNASSLSSLNVQTQQLQGDNQKHQKIQKLMQQLNIEQGVGFSTRLNVNLKGGEQKTYDFSLTAGKGMSGLESKWNLHLESQNKWNVCAEGSMNTPIISLQNVQNDNIQYFYKNNIGFGKTCEESRVSVTGKAAVSEDQKEKADQSKSSTLCKEATRKVEETRDELSRVSSGSSESKNLVQQLEEYSQKKQDSCRQSIRDHSILDEVKFNIRFSNIPQKVQDYTSQVESVIKGYLIPYVSGLDRSRNTNDEINVDLKFHNDLHTVDMILTTEQETLKYKSIRLPQRLTNVLPMVASNRLGEEALSRAIGASVYPVCRIGDSVVKTFDNSTYHYDLDDCYHVLATDTSVEATHSVLAKEVDGKKYVMAFTKKSKATISPRRSWTESNREFDIVVDGEFVQLDNGERKQIRSLEVNYKFERTSDDIIVMETTNNIVTVDGKTVWIESIVLPAPGHHAGLCGNLNGDKRADIQTSQSCVVSSPQEAALSFRVERNCSPLSSEKQQLKSQASSCSVPKTEKSPITKLNQSRQDKCSKMIHSLLKHGSRMCISQVPIVGCGNGCVPRSLINKSIPFTCLPANRPRVNELYEERVRNGEILPELRNMDVTFSAKMEVPVSCTHPGL